MFVSFLKELNILEVCLPRILFFNVSNYILVKRIIKRVQKYTISIGWISPCWSGRRIVVNVRVDGVFSNIFKAKKIVFPSFLCHKEWSYEVININFRLFDKEWDIFRVIWNSLSKSNRFWYTKFLHMGSLWILWKNQLFSQNS